MSLANKRPCLLWFWQDLRLQDNPALQAAIASGQPVIPFYVFDPDGEDNPPGGASRWWLHHALTDLADRLQAVGLRLTLLRGNAEAQIAALCTETGAQAVYANRHYEPAARARQEQICHRLKHSGVQPHFQHNATLLFEPEAILNKSGTPFLVFTPYWRTCCNRMWPRPQPTDFTRIALPTDWPASLQLQELELLPRIGWDSAFYTEWEPTRDGALKRLQSFLHSAAADYTDGRDLPATDGTSRLSPWLHFGQIGPREIVASVSAHRNGTGANAEKFLAEIGWREFSYYLLHHHPQMPTEPLREQFAHFPWRRNERLLQAWQRGQTGYPFIDAGMRQLWQTGWMHNRVRMVVASFLVKNLLQPWQAGAEWFRDTLVDADLAANSQGWQWSAGCGVDAAPYFRVFNPVTQGERFDSAGEYVRRWVPELKTVPAKYIHRPWEAPEELLLRCDVRLGQTYPEPVIGLMEGRIRALGAYESFTAATKARS